MLSVPDNSIGGPDLEQLCGMVRGRHADALAELDLSDNNLGDVALCALAEAFAATPPAPGSGLEYLKLQSVEASDDFGEALANAMHRGALASLLSLNLSFNNLQERGFRELSLALSAHACPDLEALVLENNNAGDQGLHHLCLSIRLKALANLTRLDVRSNRGHAALQHLSIVVGKMRGCPRLRFLGATGNPPGGRNVEKLFHKWMPLLTVV